MTTVSMPPSLSPFNVYSMRGTSANGKRISGLAKLSGLSHVAERIHRNKPTMRLEEENKERTRRQGYME
ncbi:hypothetical protein KAT55_02170 [Candidatus Bathyarchaeota archaeon]|nr:hypothetical protein [Candidatus Bathyarchaeota archaeon]